MKQGAKVVKVIAKKKISKYNIEQCKSEIARLESCHLDKNGVNMGDSSQYLAHVKSRLAELS
jgi:hypothetical protein